MFSRLGILLILAHQIVEYWLFDYLKKYYD